MVEAKALPDTKTRLLDAALLVIRTKGYAGTSVDDLCHAAGVTKGAFFHHFKSKEDMAVAAAAHFGAMAEGLFSQAGYRTLADPLERLLAYVDFRKSILAGHAAGVHLPARHPGAGGLRNPSGHRGGGEPLHQRTCDNA